MLITTRDRLVRPSKQRELAEALRAYVIEIDAEHDLPLVRGEEYARLTKLAVDTVASAAGVVTPPRERTKGPSARPGRAIGWR